jgi:peptide/nickel transport system substrate-binding protein
MLVDYIASSSWTFDRNPDYWDKDPVGPGKGNQLPYVDGVKWLVIPDASTRLAALRTGQVDRNGVGRDDAPELKENYPDLQWVRLLDQSVAQIHMRTDVKPFDDIRVRKAMAMAIDRQAIKNDYYGGEAEILSWPVMGATPEFVGAYLPLEDMPEEVQELFEYNPERAKELLAEAGYPNGFDTEVLTFSSYADMCALLAAYWADIGVNVEIDLKDYAVWQSIAVAKNHPALLIRYMGGYHPQRAHQLGPGAAENFIMIDDPIVNDFFVKIGTNFTDYAARDQLIRELSAYALAQCWYVQPPASYSYLFWQPWLKNFNGAFTPGYSNSFKESKYIWIDQDLKEEMTGER